MQSFRKAFTLIELLVVIAIIAILAAILFPVFAQAKAAAKQTASISNWKQGGLSTMMYASDYDDRTPRMDNNGSCLYGDVPCATPDWGDSRNDGRDPNGRPMLTNVIQPYMKNFDMMYSQNVGKTNWRAAFNNIPGTRWDGAYQQSREDVYYGVLGQLAVNINMIERWVINGAMSRVERPSETILFADSVWDNNASVRLRVGNTGIWPHRPRTRCAQLSGQGWTWYNYRGRLTDYTRAGTESGFANVVWADGSVKPMRYTNLERCDFVPDLGWAYYFWDPRK